MAPGEFIKCTARSHLRGADFSVYDAARQLTARSRQIGESAICNASRVTLSRMTSYCERTITECRERLVTTGWFKPVSSTWVEDQRKTGKAGIFSTPEFIVIEHDEWAVAHPNLCGTVSTSTAHGQTADGATEDGKTASTVRGRAADTVHGKPTHKALGSKPEKKPRAAGAASQVNVRSKAWLEWWLRKYERRHGAPPTISWAKNTAQLKPLIEHNSDSTVKAAAKAYLDDATSFTTGHPLGIFISQFDRWRALARETEIADGDDSSDVTVEDIRPPGYIPPHARSKAQGT